MHPPPIDPIAIQLGPLTVRWYGIIMVSAILLGTWLAGREARRLGLSADFVYDLALWVVPSAIVGARLYEVFVLSWGYYREHPAEIPAIWLGGLAIHGAVFGGALAGYLYLRRHRADFWLWADIAAPSVILGQAIGRWGNFFNQEAYGTPAPDWVVRLLPPVIREQMWIGGTYVHPTFLYESLWNLAVFAFLLWLRHRNPRRGVVFLAYVAGYNLGRFVIEGIRTDSSFLPGGLRVAQVVALGLLVLGLVGIPWRRRVAGARYADVPGAPPA